MVTFVTGRGERQVLNIVSLLYVITSKILSLPKIDLKIVLYLGVLGRYILYFCMFYML